MVGKVDIKEHVLHCPSLDTMYILYVTIYYTLYTIGHIGNTGHSVHTVGRDTVGGGSRINSLLRVLVYYVTRWREKLSVWATGSIL